VVIVLGHHKIYVNDPGLIDHTFMALGLSPAAHSRAPPAHASVSGRLATAASQILDAVAFRFPGLRMRSLRDVIFHVRRGAFLSTDEKKFVQGLHHAYSFVRHMPDADVQELTGAVCHSLISSIDVDVADAADAAAGLGPPGAPLVSVGEDLSQVLSGTTDGEDGYLSCCEGVVAACGSGEPQERERTLARQRQRLRRTRRKGRTRRLAEAGSLEQKLERSEGDATTGEAAKAAANVGHAAAQRGFQGFKLSASCEELEALPTGLQGAADQEPIVALTAAGLLQAGRPGALVLFYDRDARAARLRAALLWRPGSSSSQG